MINCLLVKSCKRAVNFFSSEYSVPYYSLTLKMIIRESIGSFFPKFFNKTSSLLIAATILDSNQDYRVPAGFYSVQKISIDSKATSANRP